MQNKAGRVGRPGGNRGFGAVKTIIARLVAGFVLLALAWSAAGCVMPGRGPEVNEIRRFEAPADGLSGLDLGTLAGRIEVEAWEQDTVAVTVDLAAWAGTEAAARAALERVEVDVRTEGGILYAHASWPVAGLMGTSARAALYVQAPPHLAVRAKTGSGSHRVWGWQGPLDLTSGSGSIAVEGAAATGPVYLQSGSGSLRLEGYAGSIAMRSGSGSQRLTATAVTDLEMRTGSGRLQADVALRPGSRVDLETGSGSVNLALAGPTGAQLDLRTGSGRITITGETAFSGSRRATATLGDGAAEVRVQTGSGSIRVEQNP